MAYTFALKYLNQYPAEKVGPSTFACDTTIRNAKFSSSLQSLSTPMSDDGQTIFDILIGQNWTMSIDLINTRVSCKEIAIVTVVDSLRIPSDHSPCTSSKGVVSMSVDLSTHKIGVRVSVNSMKVIGGVRVGITGAGQENERYHLKELDFRQAFHSPSARTLGQSPAIQMSVTKVSSSSILDTEFSLTEGANIHG